MRSGRDSIFFEVSQWIHCCSFSFWFHGLPSITRERKRAIKVLIAGRSLRAERRLRLRKLRHQLSWTCQSLSQQRVTQLLAQWSHGDDAALAELTPLVYEELRRVAHHYMERATVGAHAANDGAGQRGLSAPGRPNQSKLARTAHTSSPWPRERCAKSWSAMPRTQHAQKRGGGALKVELDEAALVSPEQSKEIVDLHEALEQTGHTRLKKSASRRAEIFRRAQLR